MLSRVFACVAFLMIGCVSLASASDQIPGPPQVKPIAIVGGTLHTISGDDIEGGTILFDAGKITAVDRDVTLPEGIEVIDAQGKHIYPGLIEASSDIGLVEINSLRDSIDSREIGDINPNVQARVAFNPDSELIPVNRANGILSAISAPSGGLIAGRSALMLLDGWTREDMTLKADTAMHVRWPRTQEGVTELEVIIEQTRRYVQARAAERGEQPLDLRLESMAMVVIGGMPLVVSADDLDDIQAAVAFARRFDLRLIIEGGADAGACLPLLKSEKVPVIVSAVYRTPSRRHSPYDEAYTLPKRLHEAGVQFCISAGGRFGASGVRNLPYNAATAAAYGLSEKQALRSITLSPAEIFGVSKQVGSLRIGSDATLFIADGNILETPTQVEMAFIQGRRVDLGNKHTQLYHKYSEKYRRRGQ
jgi:imidazolonepropionase-like amidohydrolase